MGWLGSDWTTYRRKGSVYTHTHTHTQKITETKTKAQNNNQKWAQ